MVSICRNVVSFSDGLPEKGNGIPYFYLTTLDPTARNALKDQRASLAISESPLGTCSRDPMNPTCSKLTLTGKVKEFFLIDTTKKLTVKCFGLYYLIIMFQLLILEGGSEEAQVAKKALFTKHPEMMGDLLFHSSLKIQIYNRFYYHVMVFLICRLARGS